MDTKIKYLILFSFLIADLFIHILYFPNLWNLIYTAFFIFFMFDQLEIIVSESIRRILCYLMMLFCFIDGALGLISNSWVNVYVSFGLLLVLIWFYLKLILDDSYKFFLRNNHAYLALKIINLYIFVYGKNPNILALKGGALNLLEKYSDALECLEESKKLGYTNPYLYTEMGLAWMFLENNEKSYEYFKLAIDNDPNNIGYLYNISYILIQLENYDESLYYIEKALKLNEESELFNELKEVIEKEIEM